MAKYFYRGNKNPYDMTDEIILDTDGAGNIISRIFRGGNSAEITQTQYDGLKDRFVLELDETGPLAQQETLLTATTDSNANYKEEVS